MLLFYNLNVIVRKDIQYSSLQWNPRVNKILSTKRCKENTGIQALKIQVKYLNVGPSLPKYLQTSYLLSNIRRSICFYTNITKELAPVLRMVYHKGIFNV